MTCDPFFFFFERLSISGYDSLTAKQMCIEWVVALASPTLLLFHFEILIHVLGNHG